ncbi:SRPBCC family protein [Aeromicrobium sp.]|uniref:SRPBCC family protein n=1 Tax=Aeromicrobium sp. TaxID=1871063 RepID=UPI002FC96C73
MGQPPLVAEIEIAASPEDVWAAISDVPSMKKRSPELVVMRTFGKPKVGRRSLNINRRKGFAWPTTARITRWKPPTNDSGNGSFAFHVWPTDVEWSYDLEPTSTGTRVVERRTALPDPSLSVRLTAKWALGGADNHDTELLAGMNATLAALKAEVEPG